MFVDLQYVRQKYYIFSGQDDIMHQQPFFNNLVRRPEKNKIKGQYRKPSWKIFPFPVGQLLLLEVTSESTFFNDKSTVSHNKRSKQIE